MVMVLNEVQSRNIPCIAIIVLSISQFDKSRETKLIQPENIPLIESDAPRLYQFDKSSEVKLVQRLNM